MDDILEADQVNGTRLSSVAVFILMLILAASAMSLVCIRRPSEQQSESAIIKTPTSDTKTVTVEGGEILSIDPQPPGPTLVGSLTVVYPEEVRKAGIQGTVKLHIYVNDEGRVTKVKVAESLHPALDSAATEAARKCVFQPMIVRGQPVGVWILLPVIFSLQDSPRQNP